MNTISRKTTLSFALLALVSAPLAFAQDAATQAADPAAEAATHDPAKKSWAEVDVDGDGAVSMDEAQAVPALGAAFAQADANADGSLTGEEYKAYVAQVQAEASTGTAADASALDDPQPQADETGEADATEGDE